MYTKEECYRLGSISRLHGYKGELSLFLDVDDIKAYKEMELVFVDFDNRLVPFFIESLRFSGKRNVVVKFEDVTTEKKAKFMVGHPLYLPLETLPETEGNEFYYFEIEGYAVIDENHGPIGIVEKVLDHGNNPIIQINFEGKEILIPKQDQFIVELDREEKILKINAPEGLIDMYLGK